MTPVLGQTVTPRRAAGALVVAAALLQLIASRPAIGQAASDPRLSSVEQKIVDYVRAHESDQIAFLEKAVNINRGTFNRATERAAILIYRLTRGK